MKCWSRNRCASRSLLVTILAPPLPTCLHWVTAFSSVCNILFIAVICMHAPAIWSFLLPFWIFFLLYVFDDELLQAWICFSFFLSVHTSMSTGRFKILNWYGHCLTQIFPLSFLCAPYNWIDSTNRFETRCNMNTACYVELLVLNDCLVSKFRKEKGYQWHGSVMITLSATVWSVVD